MGRESTSKTEDESPGWTSDILRGREELEGSHNFNTISDLDLRFPYGVASQVKGHFNASIADLGRGSRAFALHVCTLSWVGQTKASDSMPRMAKSRSRYIRTFDSRSWHHDLTPTPESLRVLRQPLFVSSSRSECSSVCSKSVALLGPSRRESGF